MTFERPRVVISKCIEHGHCRFDGSMITNSDIDKLKEFVDFMPLCPEMGMGLPSPRESLRIIKPEEEHLLVFTKSGIDMTKEMIKFSEVALSEISEFKPDGFCLKSRSPSCGIKEVMVYKSIGKVPSLHRSGKGIFGNYMMEAFPELVFEDEGRLSNFSLREHFYTFIFTKAAFRKIKENKTMKDLVEFHSSYKYLFMAYSQNQLSILGKIVANHKKLSIDEIYVDYEQNLNKILIKTASPGQYINVMMHIFGYFSKELSTHEKAYFVDQLENYRSKRIPQSTVMSLLWSWVIRFEEKYLMEQRIFEPFPKKLIQVTDSGKGI